MSQKDTRIAVLGDGGWGTALTLLLAHEGYPVTVWGAFPDYLKLTREKRENVKFFPGFAIPDSVKFEADIQKACQEASVIVLAIPSQHMRNALSKVKPSDLKNKIIVNVSKGIEAKTQKVIYQIVQEVWGHQNYCTLSGPNIAREVALKMPSAAAVFSKNPKASKKIREIFTTDYFSLFEASDILGAELGGSIKNVIAIMVGITQGLGYGANTQAALFARGIAEMARLGQKMGAKRQTFMGLSGLGDLATTCISPHSRNRSFGEDIGKGKKPSDILKNTHMVIEGAETSKSAYQLSKKYKVSMPITEAVYGIIFKNYNPRQALITLLKKGPKGELE